MLMRFMMQYNKKIMQSSSIEQTKQRQEISAVHRLLEVAQKKNNAQQHWHHHHEKDQSRASNFSLLAAHKKRKEKLTESHHIGSEKQKYIEKERLKQLIQHVENQEEIDSPVLMRKKKELEKSQEEMRVTMRFLKNAKLRPFNSNMTFYSAKKDQKKRYLSTSLAFHKGESKEQSMKNLDASHQYRLIGADEVLMKRQLQSSNQLVYFKPSKSQTVRELLNHMKEERAKNQQIILDSTDRGFHEQRQESESSLCIFNEFQLRMMNRYRRFIPFQKDENLLLRKMLDGQNIWLKRYKQGWLRRRSQKEGKRSLLKRLIVKN